MSRGVIKLMGIVLALLVFAPMAFASTVEFEPVIDKIDKNSIALFNIKITNNASFTDTFSIYSPDVEWIVAPFPLENQSLDIPNGQSKTINLTITPTKYITDGGLYGVQLFVRARRADELTKNTLTIDFKGSGLRKGYVPTVKAELMMPEDIDPGAVEAELQVENLNRLELDGLRFEIMSNVNALNKAASFSLGELEAKAVPLKFNLGIDQAPGEYEITGVIKYGDSDIYNIRKVVVISEYDVPFKSELSISSEFLKARKELKVQNPSNIQKVEDVTIPTNIISNIFTRTEPDTDSAKKDGKRVLLWELDLKPGEETTVTAAANYRPLFYIILIIAIIAVILNIIKSPLKIEKKISNIVAVEGGVKEMKVILRLKNQSSGRMLKDIRLEDSVPALAAPARDMSLGSIAPKEIKRRPDGIVLRWQIDELGPNEERVISYKIKSKLSIIGRFELPIAKAVHLDNKGRRMSSYSNMAAIE